MIIGSSALVAVVFQEPGYETVVEKLVDSGSGGRHRANLNFGDCLSYAVARLANEPLFYLGNDFAVTDIPPA